MNFSVSQDQENLIGSGSLGFVVGRDFDGFLEERVEVGRPGETNVLDSVLVDLEQSCNTVDLSLLRVSGLFEGGEFLFGE